MSNTVQANLRSLKKQGDLEGGDFGHRTTEVIIVSHTDNNNIIAEYQGVRYKAIFNPFVSQYFVDDVDGKIDD